MGFIQLDSRGFALVGLLVFVAYVVATLRQWARLRHFKGPALAGFSQLWLISCVGGGRTHLDLWEACKKYGKLSNGPWISPSHEIDPSQHSVVSIAYYFRN